MNIENVKKLKKLQEQLISIDKLELDRDNDEMIWILAKYCLLLEERIAELEEERD